MEKMKRWEWDVKMGEGQVEVAGEYTLPDYLPEIRRILRLDVSLFPDGEFTREGMTSCGGRVRYYVLYMASDGHLSSFTTEGAYAAELPQREGCEAFIRATPVGATCRPLGPRRVALRTGVLLHREGYQFEEMSESFEMEEGSYETLTDSIPCAETKYLKSGDISLSYTAPSDGGHQVLSADGRPLIREARCEACGVRVRGEVWVSLLLAREDGSVYPQRVKIPFEEYIPADGVSGESRAVAEGVLSELSCLVGEGDGGALITVDGILNLSLLVGTCGVMEVKKDLYSYLYPVDVKTKKVISRTYPAILSGCYTVDGLIDKKGMECHGATRVVGAKGEANVGEVTVENGEGIITGCVKVEGLSEGEEGYIPFAFEVPYRVRCTVGEVGGEDTTCEAVVRCVGVDARLEGDGIRAECELGVILIAKKESEGKMVEEVVEEEDHPYKEQEGIRAVYLKDGDSLWSIGKRYHTPLANLADNNSLPEGVLEHADAPYLLDGLTRLIVE